MPVEGRRVRGDVKNREGRKMEREIQKPTNRKKRGRHWLVIKTKHALFQSTQHDTSASAPSHEYNAEPYVTV